MSNETTTADAWEEFKRTHGLDWPAPQRFVPGGPTLGPLRAMAVAAVRGRPPKKPPVPVPEGMRYCWSCTRVLPAEQFSTNRLAPDGKRLTCKRCDNQLRVYRRNRLKAPTSAPKENSYV